MDRLLRYLDLEIELGLRPRGQANIPPDEWQELLPSLEGGMMCPPLGRREPPY